MRTAATGSAVEQLWDRSALHRSVASMVVGVLVLLWAFLAARGDATFREQIGPLNLAVVGGVLAGAGQGGWLLHGRRRLGRRRRAVHQHLEPLLARHRVAASAPVDSHALVTVAGATRRHRAACLLVAGKPTIPTGDGLVDCEVCRP
jgi:hypothetical protein